MSALLLSFALLGPVAPPPTGEPVSLPFDDVVAANRQALASLPACRIRFRASTVSNFPAHIEHYKGKLEEENRRWGRLSPSERTAGAQAHKAVLGAIELRLQNPTFEPEEATIEWTRTGIECRWSGPNSANKPKDVASATGGHFAVAKWDRQAPAPKWMVLDPYSFKGTTQPVYTSISGKLPIHVPLVPAMLNYDDLFITLGSNLEGVVFATPKLGQKHTTFNLSGDKHLISMFTNDTTRFYASSVSLARGAAPNWIGEYALLAAPQNESLSAEKAKVLHASADEYRAREVVKNPTYAYPLNLLWFENWKNIPGGGTYPHTLVYRHFEWVPASPSGRPDAGDVRIFAAFEYRLEVLSVELLPGESKSYAVDVPKGARLVDANAGVSQIVGATPEETVGQMLEAPRPSLGIWRLLLIVANALAVLALLYLLRQNYQKRAVPPLPGGEAGLSPNALPPAPGGGANVSPQFPQGESVR